MTKISELPLEARRGLAQQLFPIGKKRWTIAEIEESLQLEARDRADYRVGGLHEQVLQLLRKKKEAVTQIGHPAAVNKGKLIDELIAEVEQLRPSAPSSFTPIFPVSP